MHDKNIELEKEMLSCGFDKASKNLIELRKTKGESLKSSRFIIMNYLTKFSNEIEIIMNSGYKKKVLESTFEHITFDQAALITLERSMNLICAEDSTKEKICRQIGKAINDEIKYSQLKKLIGNKNFKKYCSKLKSDTSTESHLRTTMIYTINKLFENKNLKLFQLTDDESIRVGFYMITLLVERFNLIKIVSRKIKRMNRKPQYTKYYALTDEANDLVTSINLNDIMNQRQMMPMITEPKDWTKNNEGGYYTIENNFIRNKKYCRYADPAKEYVNIIQSVPFSIDVNQFNIMKHISHAYKEDIINKDDNKVVFFSSKLRDKEDIYKPEILNNKELSKTEEYIDALTKYKSELKEMYEENVSRKSKFLLQRNVLDIAKRYINHSKIYFPHSCDFRYRIYPINGTFNQQSCKMSKSMINFGEKEKVTDETIRQIKIAVAASYGHDKKDFDYQVKWVDDNIDMLNNIYINKDDANYWSDVDDPFMFIKYVTELFEILGGKSTTDVPVFFDGTNNCHQHLCAISRDHINASFVGLTIKMADEDGYVRSARHSYEDLMNFEIQVDDQEERILLTKIKSLWIEYGIKRNMSKHPVMTFTYDSTLDGTVNQIYKQLKECKKFNEMFRDVGKFKAIVFLAKIIRERIEKDFYYGNEIKKFLKGCVGVFNDAYKDTDRNLVWTNPLDFKVKQRYLKSKDKRISIKLDKYYYLPFKVDDRTLDTVAMVRGICANFIHSIDSAHLMAVCKRLKEEGILFICIHDSIGVLPSNAQRLVQILKEEFIKIHSKDILRKFRAQIMRQLPREFRKNVPDLPAKGNYNLYEVMMSDYFFK